ncbi:MarR family transcriptional regulator [Streptomyces sp. NPDC096538]|uniref:MarR family winged helix-turn-helix transcriptional regulator n=1 Tax=Streptomyces sp. NPDC096538 TaxID=3155427 RepID=UPI0033257BC5
MDERGPAMELVHLLRAVTVEFDLLGAEFAARHGLHPTDVRALIHLLDAARSGTRATPGWLGEQLRLNSAGTTALVDRLERLELVRRSRDTVDRRRVLLEVEEKATRLGWAFFGPVIDEVMAASDDFDAGELATVRRFLASVLESARATRTP